jgi:hypothetical protein
VGSSAKPFDACPYCLTELTVEAVAPVIISSAPAEEHEPEKISYQKQPEKPSGPAGCKKHMGFLSERAAKEPIPDDCLTCTDLMQCMRKKA